MERHKEALFRCCRFCPKNVDVSSPLHKVVNYAKDVKLALLIDTSGDDPLIHPPNMCSRCNSLLRRWRVKKNKTKIASPLSMEVVNWLPHSDDKCVVCPDPVKESTPAEAAKEAAAQLGIISWMEGGSTIFVKWSRGGMTVERHIVIKADNSWTVTICGVDISASQLLSSFPKTLETSAQACLLLMDVFGRQVCVGNMDFEDVIKGRTELKGVHGEVVGVVSMIADPRTDDITRMTSTVRHVKCGMLLKTETTHSKLCAVCQQYRTTLFACRTKKDKRISSENLQCSSVRNDYLLSNNLLGDKINLVQKEWKALVAQTKTLKEQVQALINREGVEVESTEEELLKTVVTENEDLIKENIGGNEAFTLLLEEQKKAMATKDGRQNRWHPAFIRFCIAIYNKSSSAYNLIRKSQFLKLPHESTLKKYLNFTTPQVGINPEVLEFIWNDWDIDNLPEHKRNVTLVFDEMKLKAGLVYSKSTGKLVGYTDLGPITNEMENFEKRLQNNSAQEPKVATQMLVMMARGICSPMRVPVAYYPTQNAPSDELYHCIWPTVKALAVNLKLCVRAFVADGASWNRKFSSHHVLNKTPGTVTYFTRHPFYRGERLYFICDVPHLVKTTRNIWENSGWNQKSRNLHYKKQDIRWTQLLDLYKWDRGEDRTCPGFRMLKKVSEAHLYLTPSMRMRVSLAGQVLSKSVAKCFALQAEVTGKHGTESTQHFIRMFDRFFDYLNVRTPYQWITDNKTIMKPYTDPNDERFTWLLEEFLPWLDEWQQEALQTPNMELKDKKKLCLSDQTLEGLRISVKSFVELTKHLLETTETDYILSDKFNQDVLEEWFSMVRSAGGANSNPTVNEFGHIHLKHLVAGSNAVSSTRGNCRQQKHTSQLDPTPLPRKKQKK